MIMDRYIRGGKHRSNFICFGEGKELSLFKQRVNEIEIDLAHLSAELKHEQGTS